MKFLDTSVLIASAQVFHTHHAAAFDLLASLTPANGATATYTLSEFYAATTRGRTPERLRPADAILFIQSFRERLTLVDLSTEEYIGELLTLGRRGIMSGGVYDALIVAAARKANATAVYTLDRDFNHVAPDLQHIMRTPGQ